MTGPAWAALVVVLAVLVAFGSVVVYSHLAPEPPPVDISGWTDRAGALDVWLDAAELRLLADAADRMSASLLVRATCARELAAQDLCRANSRRMGEIGEYLRLRAAGG